MAYDVLDEPFLSQVQEAVDAHYDADEDDL
jgi:hypothetical protein